MIVDKIDNTDSWSVRTDDYARRWYLVRDASTDSPRVISVRDRGGLRGQHHVYLDPKGATSKKVVKAVRQASSTAVRDAVDSWHAVSERYSNYGASDTEPRGVFADVFEAAIEGRKEPLPRTIRDWQIFDAESMDGIKGSGDVAKALTAAAKVVVDAVKRNPTEAREVYRYHYGYLPFNAR